MRISSIGVNEHLLSPVALRWYELRLFNLYRILVALVFGVLLLTTATARYVSLSGSMYGAGQIGVILYALLAAAVFAASESRRSSVTVLTLIGVGCDLVMGSLLLFVFGGLSSGVGVLL